VRSALTGSSRYLALYPRVRIIIIGTNQTLNSQKVVLKELQKNIEDGWDWATDLAPNKAINRLLKH